MLFMELHDGAQSVEAVEYQPMKDISTENVMPGGKVVKCSVNLEVLELPLK